MSKLIVGTSSLAPISYLGLFVLKTLKIYEVDSDYIKYLSKFQEHLFFSDGDKSNRKYIGILLEINGYKYFAPLSSFKEKHKKMKESVDFIKIRDYAVININNMVPVPDNKYKLVDIKGVKDINYRFLLQAENREINKQRNRIFKNASIVYNHRCPQGYCIVLPDEFFWQVLSLGCLRHPRLLM